MMKKVRAPGMAFFLVALPVAVFAAFGTDRLLRRDLPLVSLERLHRAGLGHWTKPAPLGDGRSFGPGEEGQPIQALQAMFGMYGYGLEVTGVYDARTEAVVAAFQRHFRQDLVDGVADASTITTLRDLIRSRPAPPSA